MKKSILLMGTLLSAALIFGCAQPDENKTSETAVENKLPESKGTNDFENKKLTSEFGTTLYFANDSVTLCENNSTIMNIRAIQMPTEYSAKYNYSYDSEKKELYLQLAELWNETEAQDYQKQIEQTKKMYKDAETSIKEGVDTAFSSIGKSSEALSLAKDIVLSKLNKTLEEQENALNDYLANKYNCLLTFSYTIDEENKKITISQKFDGDLKSASAYFSYNKIERDSSYKTIVLNGYDSLTPFSIAISSSQDQTAFVGVPEFDENARTITATLYPESATQKEGLASIITEAASSLADKTVFTELTLGKKDDFESKIDSLIGKTKYIASYELSKDEQSKDVLKLTTKTAPEAIQEYFTKDETLALSYQPTLESSFTYTTE